MNLSSNYNVSEAIPRTDSNNQKKRGVGAASLDLSVLCEFVYLPVLSAGFIIREPVHFVYVNVLFRLMNPILSRFAYSFLAILDTFARAALERNLPQRVIISCSDNVTKQFGLSFFLLHAVQLDSSFILCMGICVLSSFF